LIDAVGGSNHHFESLTRALPAQTGPGRARRDRQASSGGSKSAIWEQILDQENFENSFFIIFSKYHPEHFRNVFG
jgi:hypothetical protein